MPLSSRDLFARLIQCEAGGEGDNGMKAVATVIMNRVNVSYGEYLRICQGDLRKVILQECQFSCNKPIIDYVTNPQTTWNMNPTDEHYSVADWAIGGNILWAVAGCLWYMNPFSPQCPTYFPYNRSGVIFTRINDHCFYQPTDLYAET